MVMLSLFPLHISVRGSLTAYISPTNEQTSELCGHCHKKIPGKPVQCKEKCGAETYCDVACRDFAWEEQHRLFCGKDPKAQAAVKKLNVCLHLNVLATETNYSLCLCWSWRGLYILHALARPFHSFSVPSPYGLLRIYARIRTP